MVAIIPAAGLGKRMLEVGGGLPKELLVVGGEAILERVLDEAIGVGASEVIVVSSAAKPQIEAFVRMYGSDKVRVAFQDKPLGLAHAVAAAGVREEPVLVLMADAFYEPESPIASLAESLLERDSWACVAVRQAPIEELYRYGVVDFDPSSGQIRAMAEKPSSEDAPSNWVVAGRIGLSREALGTLHSLVEAFEPSQTEPEIHLTRVLQEGLNSGQELLAFPALRDERYFDCGDPEGYEAAIQELGA